MYNVALFLHLLGVVLLAGSVSTTLVATVRSQTADSVGALRALIAVTQRIEIVIVPAMLLIVGTGLYMVSRHGGDGSINWSAGWVVLSLILAALLSVIGGTVEGGAYQTPAGSQCERHKRAPAGRPPRTATGTQAALCKLLQHFATRSLAVLDVEQTATIRRNHRLRRRGHHLGARGLPQDASDQSSTRHCLRLMMRAGMRREIADCAGYRQIHSATMK